MKQLSSHKFARWVTPEMNYEELIDIVTSGERYRVEIAQGEVKVETMAIEDERKGEKCWRGKKGRGERVSTKKEGSAGTPSRPRELSKC